MTQASNSAVQSAAAELRVVADTIERHRERVAALATPFLGTEREDLVISINEAERQLLIAVRTLRRTIKTLDR
jgi:hypothetical protein